MKDFVYEEIRKANECVRNQIDRAAAFDTLADAILLMSRFNEIARRYGLLDLEEAVSGPNEITDSESLKELLLLVIDGTEPALIEELGITKFFALGLTGQNALQYLIYLYGSLMIQEGRHPYITRKLLMAMVPEEVAAFVEIKEEEAKEMERRKKETHQEMLNRLFSGEVVVDLNNEDYFRMKIIDHLLENLDDRSMQRLLSQTDNHELAVAMIGLGGGARKRILTNMSERLAEMISVDMESMRPVKVSATVSSANKLANTLAHLVSTGEIAGNEGEIVKLLGKVFY